MNRMTVGEILAGLSHFHPNTEVVITVQEGMSQQDFEIVADVVPDRPNTIELKISHVK